jgi:tRNA (cytidine/uridine-2'-O-)-methyltransferase
MIHVALWEPQIAPNTGNIARLCAATASKLHLIGRLGFHLDNRHLRRAGLDYWNAVDLEPHATFAQFVAAIRDARIIALSTKAERPYTSVQYTPGDCLLFGNESYGLPDEVLRDPQILTARIPMPSQAVCCLNLATAAGIALYEALRQIEHWR